jgi:hypothetical protein
MTGFSGQVVRIKDAILVGGLCRKTKSMKSNGTQQEAIRIKTW